jgi:hypothetical protein
MEAPEKSKWCGFVVSPAGEFLKSMEKYVNDNHIGIEAINAGREHKIEMQAVDAAIPSAADGIQEQP